MTVKTALEPIVKNRDLGVSCDRAFHHFTDNIHLWWPLASHSLAGEDAATVKFKAREGGRIYEVERSGKEREWGRVKVCEPPRRLVFSWVLEAPADATEVEIVFEAKGENACAMRLVHRGWETHSKGEDIRNAYDNGWVGVVDRFAAGATQAGSA